MKAEEIKIWEARANSIVENMADYTVFLPSRHRRYLPLIFLDFVTTYIQTPVVYFVFQKKKLKFAAVDQSEWERLKKLEPASLFDSCESSDQLVTSGTFGFGFSLYNYIDGKLDFQVMKSASQNEKAIQMRQKFRILLNSMELKKSNYLNPGKKFENFFLVFMNALKKLKFDKSKIKDQAIVEDKELQLAQEAILLSFENTIAAFSEPPMHIKGKDWENIFLITRYPPLTSQFNYRLGILLTKKQKSELRKRGFSDLDIRQIQAPLAEDQWTESDAPFSSGVTRFIDNPTLGSGPIRDEQTSKILEAEKVLYKLFKGETNLTLYPIHFSQRAFFVIVHVRRSQREKAFPRLSGWRSNFIFHERVMRPIADNLRKALKYDFDTLVLKIVDEKIRRLSLNAHSYSSTENLFEKLIPELKKDLSQITTYFPYEEPEFSSEGLFLEKRSLSRSEIQAIYDRHSDDFLPDSPKGLSAKNFNYLLRCISSPDCPDKSTNQVRVLKKFLIDRDAVSSYLSFTLGRALFLGFFLTNNAKKFPDNRESVIAGKEVEFLFTDYSSCSGLDAKFSGRNGEEPLKQSILEDAVERSKAIFLVTLVGPVLKNNSGKDIQKFQDIRNKATSNARKTVKESSKFNGQEPLTLKDQEVTQGVIEAHEAIISFDVGDGQTIGITFKDQLNDAYQRTINYIESCKNNQYTGSGNMMTWVEQAWYTDGKYD